MRRFHSYGPVDHEEHFYVSRKELIDNCTQHIIGKSGKGGHYFTIWAPRQTGKTWLMKQVVREIESLHGNHFIIGQMSFQGIILEEDSKATDFFLKIPKLMLDGFGIDVESPTTWEEWALLFHKRDGIFDKPVILFIDEFDSLPAKIIDRLVTIFRDIYLKRDSYIIHGLALIGVRAVLGVESLSGSPFNIQRSLHVSNFTQDEVNHLYKNYEKESGQKVEPAVIKCVFESTRGQPGLVSWFGELLTEKFNPGIEKSIDLLEWKNVYRKACHTEWNNTVLNLIKKAKTMYKQQVMDLFTRSDILFSLDADWCSYLYLNGVIDFETNVNENDEAMEICRFSSPFVQTRLYNALTNDLFDNYLPILALEPLDDLSDVFNKATIDLTALLKRYRNYLSRLKAKGLNPWKDQPRRTDMHLTEWVGHFHLYAWLQNAIGRRCSISPEFPTGNGKVDLRLRCGKKEGIIEVKSFTDLSGLKQARQQAAQYALSLGLSTVTIALFVPVEDEEVLKKLSGEQMIDKVKVSVSAIGWI